MLAQAGTTRDKRTAIRGAPFGPAQHYAASAGGEATGVDVEARQGDTGLLPTALIFFLPAITFPPISFYVPRAARLGFFCALGATQPFP
jgi:hypothetical protein